MDLLGGGVGGGAGGCAPPPTPGGRSLLSEKKNFQYFLNRAPKKFAPPYQIMLDPSLHISWLI
jgi:hypothetical protein